MMRIGEKIKQLRKEMGVTQDQLGKHLNSFEIIFICIWVIRIM